MGIRRSNEGMRGQGPCSTSSPITGNVHSGICACMLYDKIKSCNQTEKYIHHMGHPLITVGKYMVGLGPSVHSDGIIYGMHVTMGY